MNTVTNYMKLGGKLTFIYFFIHYLLHIPGSFKMESKI